MEAKNNGGPAFPMPANEYSGTGPEWGITTRDYFAAKAMNGICGHHDTWGMSDYGAIAEEAYKIADAMLAAREAK